MPLCFFATDLHGSMHRYECLFESILRDSPDAVFLGGDLLPRVGQPLSSSSEEDCDFISNFLVPQCERIRQAMAARYPRVFVILGNDDPRCEEESLCSAESKDIWRYVHGRKDSIAQFPVYGYACVPPTPFLLKDWERYDVSRYTPPASVSPEEGYRSVPVPGNHIQWGTIEKDLETLVGNDELEKAILLLHTPPAETRLDCAALDGMTYEHVPLDIHIGSIAVRRFIERKQPLLTLHGHVHESTRLTGQWMEQIGRTVCINGAHDGPELALVRFDPTSPMNATRQLL